MTGQCDFFTSYGRRKSTLRGN